MQEPDCRKDGLAFLICFTSGKMIYSNLEFGSLEKFKITSNYLESGRIPDRGDQYWLWIK